MFLLASLMALAAAGAALDLTGGHDPDEDDDGDDLGPVLGKPEAPEIGDASSEEPQRGYSDPAWPEDEPEPLPDLAEPLPVFPEPVEPVFFEAVEPVDPLPSPEPFLPVGDLTEGGNGGGDPQGGMGDGTIVDWDGNDRGQGGGAFDPSGGDGIPDGAENDSLAGQGGGILWGDEGSDTLDGSEGGDTLSGDRGSDGDDAPVSDDLDGGSGINDGTGDGDPGAAWMDGGEGADALAPDLGDSEGQDAADPLVAEPPGALPVIADFNAAEDQVVLHLPESIAGTAQIDLAEDEDGSVLITVNGDAVGRMLQSGGLAARDIVVVRLPG